MAVPPRDRSWRHFPLLLATAGMLIAGGFARADGAREGSEVPIVAGLVCLGAWVALLARDSGAEHDWPDDHEQDDHEQ
jgi:hypothetical protein